jgi:hypothetical protein
MPSHGTVGRRQSDGIGGGVRAEGDEETGGGSVGGRSQIKVGRRAIWSINRHQTLDNKRESKDGGVSKMMYFISLRTSLVLP